MRWYLSVGVCLLVILSGCHGIAETTPHEPTATSTDSEPPTATSSNTTSEPADTVTVREEGASLGEINATRVWNRIRGLVAVEQPAPPLVIVKPLSETPSPAEGTAPRFHQSFGANRTNFATSQLQAEGTYYSDHRVVLRVHSETSDDRLEALLAHEFAHAYQRNAPTELPDDRHAIPEASVVEGTAELISWRYADQYLENYDWEAFRTNDLHRYWATQRMALMPYVHGAKYARTHSEPGSPITSMYENPPTTAEQVLHGLEPGAESPVPLSVHAATGDNWGFDSTATARWSEAQLRYVLQIGLPPEQARTAAAGWGNDRRMVFVSAAGDGYAWVIRWDAVTEATEFERAFTDFQANVSVPLALQTVGNDTTVVLSGEQSFVENATASGSATNVTVTAPA